MTHSGCVYVSFFPGSPVESFQTGEYFFEFKMHYNFSTGKNVLLLLEVIRHSILLEIYKMRGYGVADV
jgi:hypothetical protein